MDWRWRARDMLHKMYTGRSPGTCEWRADDNFDVRSGRKNKKGDHSRKLFLLAQRSCLRLSFDDGAKFSPRKKKEIQYDPARFSHTSWSRSILFYFYTRGVWTLKSILVLNIESTIFIQFLGRLSTKSIFQKRRWMSLFELAAGTKSIS